MVFDNSLCKKVIGYESLSGDKVGVNGTPEIYGFTRCSPLVDICDSGFLKAVS